MIYSPEIQDILDPTDWRDSLRGNAGAQRCTNLDSTGEPNTPRLPGPMSEKWWNTRFSSVLCLNKTHEMMADSLTKLLVAVKTHQIY